MGQHHAAGTGAVASRPQSVHQSPQGWWPLAQLAADNFEKTPNTQIFNQTGQPAISLPLHSNAAGLPIGVQFSAAYGDEATLLRLAGQLELARPWIGRKPGVCAC